MVISIELSQMLRELGKNFGSENVVETQTLPIVEHKKEIMEAIKNNDVVIIVGETGSGKTTQIPEMILETMDKDKDRIAITQPRVVAATSVARYVADEVGTELGDKVGFHVRFNDRTHEGTKLNFMTGGILLRKMQGDLKLSEYSAVMVDEVHERSLDIDLILGLLQETQKARTEAGMERLKVVITSATLEKEKLADFYSGAPVIEVKGRLHPVEIHYEDRSYDGFDDEKKLPEYVVRAVEKINEIDVSGKTGDILVFMPGVDDIRKTIKGVEELNLVDTIVLPLHGQLSPDEQNRIFDEKDPRRKIIVSTNVAETSVTVPRVKHVIDTGLIKQTEFDHTTGIGALVIVDHAKNGCVQRMGRAGRVSAGDCWRLYTERDFNNRKEFQLPEIQRSDLAHVVLMMKGMGIDKVESFKFIDPPETNALRQAVNTLESLGAIDGNGELTEVGRKMVELPLEPHIAKMVIEAKKFGCVEEVCTIAAFLGMKPVFVEPSDNVDLARAKHEKFKDNDSDFLTFLNVWREYKKNGEDGNWCWGNFLNVKVLREVALVRRQLLDIVEWDGKGEKDKIETTAIEKSITAGLIDNLAIYFDYGAFLKLNDRRNGLYVHPSSVIFRRGVDLVVCAQIMTTTRNFMKNCQEVRPEWLIEIAPNMVKMENSEPYYEEDSDKVRRDIEIFLKDKNQNLIRCSSETKEVKGSEAVKAFANFLSGKRDLMLAPEIGKIWKKVDELNARAGGIEIDRLEIKAQLALLLMNKLRKIQSMEGLRWAIYEKGFNLGIGVHDLISEEKIREIYEKYPEEEEVEEEKRESLDIGRDWWSQLTRQTNRGRDIYRGNDNSNRLSFEDIGMKASEELITEVNELMSRKNAKPRRKALIQAVLIGRGPEVMAQTEIKRKYFPEIINELDVAVKEARNTRNYGEVGILEKAIGNVKMMDLVELAVGNDLVKDYIGDDPGSIGQFKTILYEKMKGKNRLPNEEEMRDLIDEVIEKMTS